jgi:hypothetical protein
MGSPSWVQDGGDASGTMPPDCESWFSKITWCELPRQVDGTHSWWKSEIAQNRFNKARI